MVRRRTSYRDEDVVAIISTDSVVAHRQLSDADTPSYNPTSRRTQGKAMSDEPNWLPYQSRPGGTLVALGPFDTREHAMRERERIKSEGTNDYFGIPFTAASKED